MIRLLHPYTYEYIGIQYMYLSPLTIQPLSPCWALLPSPAPPPSSFITCHPSSSSFIPEPTFLIPHPLSFISLSSIIPHPSFLVPHLFLFTSHHCSLIRIQIMLQNFKYAVPQQPHYIRTRLLMTNPWDFRPTAKRACGMIIVPW